jgi:hypothetical protein
VALEDVKKRGRWSGHRNTNDMWRAAGDMVNWFSEKLAEGAVLFGYLILILLPTVVALAICIMIAYGLHIIHFN